MTEGISIGGPMLLFLMAMTGFAGFVDSAAGGGGGDPVAAQAAG